VKCVRDEALVSERSAFLRKYFCKRE